MEQTASVWAVGCGHGGRLGLGNEKNAARFTPVVWPAALQSLGAPLRLAVGGYHTFVVCEHGVVGFGCNDEGQLGLGDRANRSTPVRIEFFGDASTLAVLCCGALHSVALLRDGSLYATGHNAHGQLGLGDTESRSRWTKLSSYGDATVHSVSCGSYHTLALVSPGGGVLVPMACGKGDFGELGFDADAWDTAAQREAHIKAMAFAHGRDRRMAEGVNSEARSSAAEAKPFGGFRFKKPAPTVKRREAFFRTTLSTVLLPQQEMGPDEKELSILPVEVKGMHHHSALRCLDGTWWSFGCYYCDQIEDDASSRPRRVCVEHRGDAGGIHAANETQFAWSPSWKGLIFVRGKGRATGLPQDDPFEPNWVPLDLRRLLGLQDDDVTVEWVRGVEQVWVCLRLRSGERRYLCTGDNYFGQLAVGDEDDRVSFVCPNFPPEHDDVIDVHPGLRHTIALLARRKSTDPTPTAVDA